MKARFHLPLVDRDIRRHVDEVAEDLPGVLDFLQAGYRAEDTRRNPIS